jgi:hypothetical protein
MSNLVIAEELNSKSKAVNKDTTIVSDKSKHPIKSPLYDKLIIRTFAIKKDYEQKSTHGAESVYSDKQPPFDEWTHNKGIL